MSSFKSFNFSVSTESNLLLEIKGKLVLHFRGVPYTFKSIYMHF